MNSKFNNVTLEHNDSYMYSSSYYEFQVLVFKLIRHKINKSIRTLNITEQNKKYQNALKCNDN